MCIRDRSNKEKAIKLSGDLPNTLVIHGDGRNAELLLEENIGGMDVFLAVTDDSETNIMSCLMAKSNKVSKIIGLSLGNYRYVLLTWLDKDTTSYWLVHLFSRLILYLKMYLNNATGLFYFAKPQSPNFLSAQIVKEDP